MLSSKPGMGFLITYKGYLTRPGLTKKRKIALFDMLKTNAPINVKPAGGRQGMGWGFDRLCWPWGRAFD